MSASEVVALLAALARSEPPRGVADLARALAELDGPPAWGPADLARLRAAAAGTTRGGVEGVEAAVADVGPLRAEVAAQRARVAEHAAAALALEGELRTERALGAPTIRVLGDGESADGAGAAEEGAADLPEAALVAIAARPGATVFVTCDGARAPHQPRGARARARGVTCGG